jgi:predicted ATPase
MSPEERRRSIAPAGPIGNESESLAELIERRQELEVALAVHEASVRKFWPADRPSFVIQLAELDALSPDDGKGRPRHLTSTASCFESLADLRPGLAGRLPSRDRRGRLPWNDIAPAFAQRALACPPADWTSDEAAHIYCRVRALPAVLRYAPPLAGAPAEAEAARSRLQEAFSVIDKRRPLVDRGLGERLLRRNGRLKPEPPGELYPANTFHAYWGLKAHRRYLERRSRKQDLPELTRAHHERVLQNQAWSHAAIGRHTALLDAAKRRGDAQQLAFAVMADLLAHDGKLTPASGQYDLYQAAIAAFFAAQEPSGRWPLSRPLFHYPISGNAYCYTFETLTELLRPALPREEGRTYRGLLEPYLPKLFAAWDYAMRTRVPLDDRSGGTYGWSSTHHIGRDAPEAWATAAVFSYGQVLRCMSGHIVAERAATELGVRRPDYPERKSAEEDLAARGDTWVEDEWTVGRELASLFLHPTNSPRETLVDDAIRDPDAPVIGTSNARSAVLFGPPGTGKTTLVEALAGALGWRYVEILASDFLREGVDGVPAQADRIFERIMQLDRCVVLFDEIDELIQDRTRESSDPFGRFLTTSMLPKIAKLWKQRRLIFFVATNHVSRADAAITRTSRFDARIFVAPPGLAVKERELRRELEKGTPSIDAKKVRRALAADDSARQQLKPADLALGVLPLLRFDQIPELARRLRASGEPEKESSLQEALEQMRDDLLHHEWQPADKPESWGEWDPAQQLRFVYREYLDDVSRDFSRQRVLRVEPHGDRTDLPHGWQEIPGEHRPTLGGSDLFFEAPDDLANLLKDDGMLQLSSAPPLADGGLLWFRGPQEDGDEAPAE